MRGAASRHMVKFLRSTSARFPEGEDPGSGAPKAPEAGDCGCETAVMLRYDCALRCISKKQSPNSDSKPERLMTRQRTAPTAITLAALVRKNSGTKGEERRGEEREREREGEGERDERETRRDQSMESGAIPPHTRQQQEKEHTTRTESRKKTNWQEEGASCTSVDQ